MSILSVPYCVPLGISQTQASSPFLPKRKCQEISDNAAPKKRKHTKAGAVFCPASASSSLGLRESAHNILRDVFKGKPVNPEALNKASVRNPRPPAKKRPAAADLSDKGKKKAAPAKKELKMTHKCIMSRVYKAALKVALEEGRSQPRAARFARKACEKERERIRAKTSGGNTDGAPPDVW